MMKLDLLRQVACINKHYIFRFTQLMLDLCWWVALLISVMVSNCRAVITKMSQMWECHIWCAPAQIHSRAMPQLWFWVLQEEHWHQDCTMHQAFLQCSFLKLLLLSAREWCVSMQWQKLVIPYKLFAFQFGPENLQSLSKSIEERVLTEKHYDHLRFQH